MNYLGKVSGVFELIANASWKLLELVMLPREISRFGQLALVDQKGQHGARRMRHDAVAQVNGLNLSEFQRGLTGKTSGRRRYPRVPVGLQPIADWLLVVSELNFLTGRIEVIE